MAEITNSMEQPNITPITTAVDDFSKYAGWRSFFRRLVFITFGIVAFSNPLNRLAIAPLLFGVIIGLFYGFLCKIFISNMLSLFNPKLRKEKGKKTIKRAVEHGMMYMIPFAMMALVASFYLGWTLTTGFFSTAMMTASGIAAYEIGRLRGKPAIKNTILASLLSWIFTTLWIVSLPYLGQVPGYIDGAMTLIRSLSSGMMN